MLLGVYESGSDTVVAVCDDGLLGNTYREGEIVLKVTDFYRGNPATPEEVRRALRGATIANLVGQESVDLAVEEGIVDPDTVIHVEGVAHAQMVCML